MISERVVPVVLSVVIIILVAVVQERSRSLAALLASMPLTAPLAMWIVFSATRGDHDQTAAFTSSMAIGFGAGLGFVLAGWAALRWHWAFPLVLLFAGGVWIALAALGFWLRSVR